MSAIVYRIKGSGSERTVMDGDVVIGTIQRRERKTATVTVRIGVSASWRQRIEVYWVATRADGSWVVNRYDSSERATGASMKYWAEPRRWAP